MKEVLTMRKPFLRRRRTNPAAVTPRYPFPALRNYPAPPRRSH